MKQKTIKLLLLTGCLICLSNVEVNAQNKVTIVIRNIKKRIGSVRIGIFNKKENYPIPKKEAYVLNLPVHSNEVQYTLKNVPNGNYAIAVFHDENNDNECNKNFIGIPTEPFGFSNDAKPVLSAPSFEKTNVKVSSDYTVAIKLQN